MDKRSEQISNGFLKNAWYVAAWSGELQSGKPLSRTILGRTVVIYRTAGGGVVAMDDRCPHRAAPLSLGKCEGDDLRCMYHGLLFDRLGACIEMPHQERPPRLTVRTYPVVERNRLIWIWCGDAAQASKRAPLALPWLDSPEWRGKPGYMHYKADYRLIADNLLDFTHSAYVHRTTFGSPAVAAVKQSVTRDGSVVRVVRHLPDIEPLPFHIASGAGPGRVDMWQEYEWICPSTMSMDSGSAPSGMGALQGGREKANIRFRHLTFLTPETEHTTHYFFIQLRAFKLDDPLMDDVVFEQVSTAFAEDQAIIEAQQRVIDQTHDDPLGVTVGDLGLVQVRRIIESMIEDEVGAASAESVCPE